MPLEIIGAGLGRTGTMSLKVALETLGFGPCYHMTEVFENPEHVPLWEAAIRGEGVDWEDVFARYRSTTDYPAASFYEDLMERYPDAKVILTVRDPERWYRSARSTIFNVRGVALSPVISIPARFVPRLRGIRAAATMAGNLVWDREFEGRFEDREYAIGAFRRHNEEVRRRVTPEKLLVYEVKQGWGPLCAFLGVPVPDEPFPRLNDGAVFRRRIRVLKAVSAATTVVPALALIYVLLRTLRRAS